MDRLEYQIMFMAFFIGLGVADLFRSLVRLLKMGTRVRWHVLTVMWCVTAFLGLLVAWAVYPQLFGSDLSRNAPGFIAAISPAIFIFAFTVSILPHDLSSTVVDLKAHYYDHHRLIFSLLLLDLASRTGTHLLLLGGSIARQPTLYTAIAIVTAVVVGLIVTRNRIYHAFGTALVLVFYILMLVGLRFE